MKGKTYAKPSHKCYFLVTSDAVCFIIPPLTVILDQLVKDCEHFGLQYVDVSKVRMKLIFTAVKVHLQKHINPFMIERFK